MTTDGVALGGVDATAAYRRCEAVTRSAAGNFYWGIRLLPVRKRQAMCAVYAFARRIDDIGDGSLDSAEKLRRLDAERDAVTRMGADSDDAVHVALADASERFPLPADAFGDLIDGVRMDVEGTAYEDFDALVVYCRRVAGSIGRLCLAIFGSSGGAEAARFADDLGVAMQLANILRDVREDSERGRVYLPADDLERLGCQGGAASAPRQAFAALVRFEAARAHEWFDRGLRLLPMLDRRSAACVAAMTGIYRRLLDRMEADPEAVRRGRMSLPAWEKAWVAARSLAGAGA